MITYDFIIDAQNILVECWEEQGKRVIEACSRVTPFNGTFDEFLKHCSACGGNWGGMLLTGIKKLYPEVWDAIPEEMGYNAFGCICNVLILCGIDTSTSK